MSLMSNPAGALSLQSRRLERRVARAALFCPDDESCGFPPAEAGTPYPQKALQDVPRRHGGHGGRRAFAAPPVGSQLRAPCSLPRSRGLAVWRESLFSAPMPGLTSCLDRQAGDS